MSTTQKLNASTGTGTTAKTVARLTARVVLSLLAVAFPIYNATLLWLTMRDHEIAFIIEDDPTYYRSHPASIGRELHHAYPVIGLTTFFAFFALIATVWFFTSILAPTIARVWHIGEESWKVLSMKNTLLDGIGGSFCAMFVLWLLVSLTGWSLVFQ